MPDLSIKNVPLEVVQQWRDRAAANHRSLQGELLALVTREAGAPRMGVEAGSSRHARTGHKSIEQIVAEQLDRNPKPIRKGERAVDLIRKDRDQR